MAERVSDEDYRRRLRRILLIKEVMRPLFPEESRHHWDDSIGTIRTILESPRRNLRALRMLESDFGEMLQDAPLSELARYDEALRLEGFGSINDLLTGRMRRIRKILDRGRIKSDEEFELLQGVSIRLPDTPEEQDLYDRANALIQAHEVGSKPA